MLAEPLAWCLGVMRDDLTGIKNRIGAVISLNPHRRDS